MVNFPTSLDTSTTIPAEGASTPLSTNHVTAHQNIQDAIEVIEAKIGVDSSAVTTSHDYKLSGVTGSDKALKSGTSTQSVTGLTLVTPKITVGSDAVGDLHYVSNVDGTLSRLAKGTDNQILKMNGTALNWEAETVVVAATEAVEGISRLATAAQITAGTASEASYPLVVTPDQLALSTPVFDGSGLTAISKLVSASANVKHSADTERTFTGTTPTLVKTIVVNHPGSIRISVDVKTSSGNMTWKVSSNDGGTLATNGTNSAVYVTQTSDIYVKAGETLNLYINGDGGGVTAYAKNYRISYDIGTFANGSVITD